MTNTTCNRLLQFCEDGNHLLLKVCEKVVKVIVVEHLDTPSTLLLNAVSGGSGRELFGHHEDPHDHLQSIAPRKRTVTNCFLSSANMLSFLS